MIFSKGYGGENMVGIAEKRKQFGYSQKQLADMLQIDRTTVSKWEVGEAKPRAEILKKLSEIFKCSMEELW